MTQSNSLSLYEPVTIVHQIFSFPFLPFPNLPFLWIPAVLHALDFFGQVIIVLNL